MLRPLPLAATALALATLLLRFQDPKPTPPAPAPVPVPVPAPPAAEPAVTAPGTAAEPGAPATKAPAGRQARNPIEGVYELRARVIAGKRSTVPSRGWLAITERHLFLCVSAPGSDPDAPLLRSVVRTWQSERELGFVKMTTQIGWFTDAEGTVHLEPTGTDERRRIELIRGGVRFAQDHNNFLEFERVE